MDLLDRKDNERSYEQTMTGLQEDLKYWQVRTSEEARKKLLKFKNRLTKKNTNMNLKKQKESLQDKIDVLDDEIDEVERTADEEKKKRSGKNLISRLKKHSILIAQT